MNYVNINSVVIRKEGIIASDMDGETVMMNIETGKYYNLGKTGGAIWNIVKDPIEVEEIIKKLMENYNVAKEQCEQDVVPFLQQMAEQGLLLIA